ncbi:hypothetical protein KY285_032915 [Solanum tuberosum]|nr:hypothetical protein KY289_034735 [Solanum tuberosum]KAH0644715.1 hypothetical protein KY284_032599 [Solanum tuberosum]KAH0647667.1 hypothetical protein KY285_032915 [Solanum tuberosum]
MDMLCWNLLTHFFEARPPAYQLAVVCDSVWLCFFVNWKCWILEKPLSEQTAKANTGSEWLEIMGLCPYRILLRVFVWRKQDKRLEDLSSVGT